MNKPSIFAIAFFAAIYTFGPSAGFTKQPPLLTKYTSVIHICRSSAQPSPNIPIKYMNRLCINTSVSYRTAVQKDEQAGIRDLCDLTKSVWLEEHWVFLPEKDLWLEIGCGETEGSAEIDQDYLETIIRENADLAIYHIHPRNYLRSKERKGYTNISETWLTLPSLEDVALMIYYSSMFNREHPRGKIAWNICSPLGMTEYALTEQGISHYRNIQQDAFLLSYFCPSHAEVADATLTPFFDIRSPHKVQDLINWANTQGKSYIRIGFTP
jgi:hypothetical protein